MVQLLTAPILITGATGQLGTALARLAAARGITSVAVGRPQFDFERLETLDACLQSVRPWAVINAAAYTAVDAAESDPGAAERANHTGPARLAALCAARQIPLIHVSTDYVFDGCMGAPYLEDDETNPTGVYGATKRDGENAILASGARAIILRTAWLYSATGKNFARTMLLAAGRSSHLKVVSDQKGSPTAAPELAKAILDIALQLQNGWRDEYRGIFHAAGSGATDWHGFACAIFAAAARLGLQAPEVEPITTAQWPTPAKRPPDSRLDCTRLERIFGCRLPDWERSLPPVVTALMAEISTQQAHAQAAV